MLFVADPTNAVTFCGLQVPVVEDAVQLVVGGSPCPLLQPVQLLQDNCKLTFSVAPTGPEALPEAESTLY